MKFFIGIVFSLVSTTAIAAQQAYDLKMELSLNGQAVASPHIIVKEGKTATVIQKKNGKETFIEIVASEKQTEEYKGILMKFKVGMVGANGQRTVLSEPQILTIENEKAQVTVGNNEHSEAVSLTVIASRTN